MPETARERLIQYIRGHQLAAIVHVAAKLELADRVGTGCRIDVLAQHTRTDVSALERLLRALAAHGIFAIDSQRWVRPTELSGYLTSGPPESLHAAALFFALPMNWRCWEALEQAVRGEAEVFATVHGQTMFQYLEKHPAESVRFHEFMSHSPDERQRAVIDAYDFSQATHIIDVGGGTGALLCAIMQRHAAASGTLYETASVRTNALRHLSAQGLCGRCRFVLGDFFVSVPAGGDLYILSQILHDWGDEDCRTILLRCRDAMRPGTKMLLIERLVGCEASANHTTNYLSDLEMLLVLGSRERTAEAYGELLLEAGLRATRVIATASPFWIVEAVRSRD